MSLDTARQYVALAHQTEYRSMTPAIDAGAGPGAAVVVCLVTVIAVEGHAEGVGGARHVHPVVLVELRLEGGLPRSARGGLGEQPAVLSANAHRFVAHDDDLRPTRVGSTRAGLPT